MTSRNKSRGRSAPSGLSRLTDTELIRAFRGGNRKSYGVLWQRHHRAALRAARASTSRVDAEDIASESFTNIMDAMLRGKGPDLAFRPYLLSAVRNTAITMGKRAAGCVGLDDDEAAQHVDPDSSDEAVLQTLESSILYSGFRTLPQRWQEVLWYIDVESLSAKETAALMGGGMTAAAVSSLAYRAREGLRQAWIREHLAQAPTEGECAWVVARIPAHQRGKGTAAEKRKVVEHAKGCMFCSMAMVEAKEASRRFLPVMAVGLVGFAVPGGTFAAHVLQPGLTSGAASSSIRPGALHGGRSVVRSVLRIAKSRGSRFSASTAGTPAPFAVLCVGACVATAVLGAGDGMQPALRVRADPGSQTRSSVVVGKAGVGLFRQATPQSQDGEHPLVLHGTGPARENSNSNSSPTPGIDKLEPSSVFPGGAHGEAQGSAQGRLPVGESSVQSVQSVQRRPTPSPGAASGPETGHPEGSRKQSDLVAKQPKQKGDVG